MTDTAADSAALIVADDRSIGGAGGEVVGYPETRRLRLSTGKLVFLVLTFALAPLGAIAVGAGTRSISTSDQERATLLRIGAQDYARRLDGRFASDAGRVSAVLAGLPKSAAMVAARDDDGQTIDAQTTDALTAEEIAAAARARAATLAIAARADPFVPVCQAVSRAFPDSDGNGSSTGSDAGEQAAFQIVDARDGHNLCAANRPADAAAIGQPIGSVRIDKAERRLVQTVSAMGDHGRVELVYSLDAIADQLPSDGILPLNRLLLMTATDELLINQPAHDNIFGLDLEGRAPIGRTGLVLTLTAPRNWFTTTEIVTLLTPLGMWLLAVLLSWLVVNSILLTPIQQLRQRMAMYRPGDTLSKPPPNLFAAQEVVMLDAMIERLADNVAADKAALAAGLEAQRALTREVHHRVKNNLQIIASLISLHSRDATSDVETRAYRAIQRRVDALAVVHRHLHAESEGEGGIALGTMLSELSVGLRHSLAAGGQPTAATIAVEPARAIQDVALPAAFFVTELFELAVYSDAREPVAIHLERHGDRPNMAILSVSSAGLIGCADRMGVRYASYERVLTGLSRQLRQPLFIDAVAGRYAIGVPIIG